ncbi:hypothetical protein DFO71_2435 [Bacillus licheniformis]|jgi:hypothetical protein|nr:hypothetical protein DEU48_108314 [Bacillus sp. AG442]TDO61329.1 hypothetical protein DFO71_2435 [Bacillus licheniformis]
MKVNKLLTGTTLAVGLLISQRRYLLHRIHLR